MLEKGFIVKYLNIFDQNTAKSPWQCPIKLRKTFTVHTCMSPTAGLEGVLLHS